MVEEEAAGREVGGSEEEKGKEQRQGHRFNCRGLEWCAVGEVELE